MDINGNCNKLQQTVQHPSDPWQTTPNSGGLWSVLLPFPWATSARWPATGKRRVPQSWWKWYQNHVVKINNKPPHIFDGLYDPFIVILGMVYYCFNHISREMSRISWNGLISSDSSKISKSYISKSLKGHAKWAWIIQKTWSIIWSIIHFWLWSRLPKLFTSSTGPVWGRLLHAFRS